MPKLRLTPEQRRAQEWEAADRELAQRIYGWLGITGHSLAEMGEMIGCSKGTMYNRVKSPETFTLEELRKLSNIIGEVRIC